MKLNKRRVNLWILVFVAGLAWSLALGGTKLLAGSEETYKGLKLFSDVIEIVEKNYVDTVEGDKLIEGALQGMVSSLDPHSTFLPPEALKELRIDTRGKFGGLGIVVSMRDGVLTVVAPLEGTPASKAGIQSGDKILKVDGKSTKDMKLWEAVELMRGEKGTSIEISIYREGFKKPKDIKLVRATIPIKSVFYAELEPGYGYIRITNFRDSTTMDVEKAISELESKNGPMKGLVLDLRNNPGGLLNQAVSVADVFLDEGEIVSIKGRRKDNNKSYSARKNNKTGNYPIVIIINSGSASAAEILAGALQDHHKALVVGTTSFGKGSVQTVEPLRDGYGLKLTVARYYTPSGRSIQAEGIKPDIEIIRDYSKKEKKDLEDDYITEKDLANHLEGEHENDGETDSETETDIDKDKKKKKDIDDLDSLFEENDTEKDNKKKDTKDSVEDLKKKAEKVYGKPDPEDLLKDNQIKRALEILVGHNMLSGKK